MAYFRQRMNRRARELCKATSGQINSDMYHQDEIKKAYYQPVGRKINLSKYQSNRVCYKLLQVIIIRSQRPVDKVNDFYRNCSI